MISAILVGFIDFLFGLIEGLLGLRVILKLFGANASAPFVNWVYEISKPLLAPFKGAFPAPALQGGFTIEFTALFAMLVYGLIGYLLLELVGQTNILTIRRQRANKTTVK